MTAKATELAEAIVEALNEAEQPQAFTARRRVTPVTDIQELQTLDVSVFTGARNARLASRAGFVRIYKPVVVVQKKLTPTNETARLAEEAQLQTLVEWIEQTLADSGPLAECGLQSFDEENDRDSYNVDALRLMGAFVVAIGLEYHA